MSLAPTEKTVLYRAVFLFCNRIPANRMHVRFITVFYLGIVLISCNNPAHQSANRVLPDKDTQVVITASGTQSMETGPTQLKQDQIQRSWKAIDTLRQLLKPGDLILRSDDDYESLTLINFSKREKVFSHAGLVFKEGSQWVVYHSITGKENPAGSIRKDPFDSFVNPVQKTGAGLFRFNLNGQEPDLLHKQVQLNFNAHIPFDIFFNLKTDDSLYCSEMIAKSLQKITKGRIQIPQSFLMDFKPKLFGYKYNQAYFKKFAYIGLDDLYLNPFCREIRRIHYH